MVIPIKVDYPVLDGRMLKNCFKKYPDLLEQDKAELAWRAHSAACSLKHWTIEDVGAWLTAEVGLPQYAESFTNMEVDGESAASLDAEFLEGLGVEPAHHAQILEAIGKQAKRGASAADRSKPAAEILLKRSLQDSSGNIVAAESALAGKVVGVYFSASWCGPCKQFTPTLIECYHEIRRMIDDGATLGEAMGTLRIHQPERAARMSGGRAASQSAGQRGRGRALAGH